VPGRRGALRNALKLEKTGVPALTLPKTIDNDVAKTDVTFGFDTALNIAPEAIDRIHSTAHSRHRIMVVEIMGTTSASRRSAQAWRAGPTSS